MYYDEIIELTKQMIVNNQKMIDAAQEYLTNTNRPIGQKGIERMSFIKLTENSTGNTYYVRIDSIVCFSTSDDAAHSATRITFSTGSLYVDESATEILRLIKESE